MPDAFLPVGADLTGNYNVNGPVGGGQGGCNYQTGNWVWGVEVDGGWSSASGQANPTAGRHRRSALNPERRVHHQRALARHRSRPPRLGRRHVDVVRDRRRRLVGLRRQQRRHRGRGQRAIAVPTRVNRNGWIVGVGTEYALLGGWSVKSEFLYANFGTFALYGDEPRTRTAASPVLSADVKLHEYVWRVGMNYRFDWASWGKGKAPVVAKY